MGKLIGRSEHRGLSCGHAANRHSISAFPGFSDPKRVLGGSGAPKKCRRLFQLLAAFLLDNRIRER